MEIRFDAWVEKQAAEKVVEYARLLGCNAVAIQTRIQDLHPEAKSNQLPPKPTPPPLRDIREGQW